MLLFHPRLDDGSIDEVWISRERQHKSRFAGQGNIAIHFEGYVPDFLVNAEKKSPGQGELATILKR